MRMTEQKHYLHSFEAGFTCRFDRLFDMAKIERFFCVTSPALRLLKIMAGLSAA